MNIVLAYIAIINNDVAIYKHTTKSLLNKKVRGKLHYCSPIKSYEFKTTGYQNPSALKSVRYNNTTIDLVSPQ